MNHKTVLVSGASIAGPTLAFWLTRFGFQVTIVERAESLRLGGQNIDVNGPARKVVQLMGIEDEIRAANTGELGVRFENENNQIKAALPKGKSNIGTSELEILRGDLAKILYNHTKDNVEYIFDNQIVQLKENQLNVTVTFQHGDDRNFDIVIAADGIRSRTRTLMFGDEPVVRPIGLYISYLTIPRIASDGNWARWHNAKNSKVVVLRPDNEGTIRASFSFLSPPMGYERLSISEQKKILREKFANVGWEVPRILSGLDNTADIYFDGISQVMAPRWSNGRLAMVGDAAFCPSPLSGMGASLSIVGAYVLAGEMSRHTNHQQAFAAYESLLRPYVKHIQKLPPGVPWLAHPKTAFGISIFNSMLRFISSGFVQRISTLFSNKNSSETDDKIVLPNY